VIQGNIGLAGIAERFRVEPLQLIFAGNFIGMESLRDSSRADIALMTTAGLRIDCRR